MTIIIYLKNSHYLEIILGTKLRRYIKKSVKKNKINQLIDDLVLHIKMWLFL